MVQCRWLLALAVTVAWIAPFNLAQATSCDSPGLGTRNTSVKQEATIRVTGTSWWDGACEEPDSTGCGGSESSPPVRPIKDIKLSMRPVKGGRTIPLTTVDASEKGGFSVKIKLPPVADGQYQLIAGDGHDALGGDSVWITKDGSLGDP